MSIGLILAGGLGKEEVIAKSVRLDMSQLLLLGKFEYGGGPIFKVVLECQKRCSEPFLISIYGIQCDFMPKSC